MNLQNILSRLDGVRKGSGEGQYMAKCPAHEDRSPSLGVKDNGDKIIINCFAGCSVDDVVSAIGLKLTDLFECDTIRDTSAKGQFLPRDIIKALSGEVMFLSVCASDMANGERLTEDDMKRLKVAAKRLHRAVEVAR